MLPLSIAGNSNIIQEIIKLISDKDYQEDHYYNQYTDEKNIWEMETKGPNKLMLLLNCSRSYSNNEAKSLIGNLAYILDICGKYRNRINITECLYAFRTESENGVNCIINLNVNVDRLYIITKLMISGKSSSYVISYDNGPETYDKQSSYWVVITADQII